ncbi:MAG: hypothetical protein HDS42_06900 [Bacteroides sp.]|nr:hypothetical protein [Bacteroides sp.]
MKFSIDKRYSFIRALLMLAGYLFGVGIVIFLLNNQDPIGFLGSSLIACVLLYVVFFRPKTIYVKDGNINFAKDGDYNRTSISLRDIVSVEISVKPYNTLKLTTKSGYTYSLHPENLQELESALAGR